MKYMDKDIDNPLKGKTPYGWHFEQNVYSENSKCIRSLKAGGGSGNIPKIIIGGDICEDLFDRNQESDTD